MIINMGKADRIIRPSLAVVFIVLFATGVVSGTWGVVLLIMATIFLLTSAVGYCPLYHLLGISSRTSRA